MVRVRAARVYVCSLGFPEWGGVPSFRKQGKVKHQPYAAESEASSGMSYVWHFSSTLCLYRGHITMSSALYFKSGKNLQDNVFS